MNQSELIAHVATTADLDKSAAAKAVDTTLAAIAGALKGGEKVSLLGLGIFEVNDRPARKGRNPATGESIDIAASKAVKFRPSKGLKDAISPPAAKPSKPAKAPAAKAPAAKVKAKA